MSKAVLVMEMPEICADCPVSGILCGKVYCNLNLKAISKNILFKSRPDWCPLRPLPEKQDLCGIYPRIDEKTPSYFIGWNDDIKAIEGGNEDDKP